uniref:DNA-directed RNA polymerase subunit beta' n=1 Tax=Trebouxiophyceae sp. MX-AZ01 TaxID=1208065 RepID=J7KEJ0_9CHLO|nr:beta' subunit of RNA polymerase [Trebouxiophyceae sp. MX-AZ01]AFQ93790.1 beta' subunit of RNA polymerase [Trebouxiophyceae sp. MX-AZ01]
MLTFRKKRELKLAQRRILIDSIQIGLASPGQIRQWAERRLPNGKRIGRVANPKTVDYKTLKPIRDGLFCERIFGPVKSFLCSCGKRPVDDKARFCPECEVEWTQSRVRRYRLGYIELGSPVTHVWYVKGQPNYVAALLGETRQSIESIAYCTRFMVGGAGLHSQALQGQGPPDGEGAGPMSQLAGPGTSRQRLAKRGGATGDVVTPPFSPAVLTRRCRYSRVLPVPISFAREPDERQLLLDFVESFAEPEDISIPLYLQQGGGDGMSPPPTAPSPRSLMPQVRGYALGRATADWPVAEGGVGTSPVALSSQVPQGVGLNGVISSLVQSSPNGGSHLARVGPRPMSNPAGRLVSLGPAVGSTEALPDESLGGGDQHLPPCDGAGEGAQDSVAGVAQGAASGTTISGGSGGWPKPRQASQPVAAGPKVGREVNHKPTGPHAHGMPHAGPGVSARPSPIGGRGGPAKVGVASPSPVKGRRDEAPSTGMLGQTDDVVLLQEVARANEIRERLRFTGGEALRGLLERLDIESLARFIRQEMVEVGPEMHRLSHLPILSRSQLILRNRLLRRGAKQGRRLKLARLLSQSGKRPEWMVLSTIPVLPPELRPIVRLDGGVVVVADLNKLYQKVLFRNSRLEELRMVDLASVGQAKRLLQEAVDGLLDNGKGGSIPIAGPNDRPLRSLSDGLKGKRGRFRQNLLGKRVDYSGRSVIVVGPRLKLHECGLPKEMAVELFQPFLSRLLMDRGLAENITAAKRFMGQDHPVLWEVLQELLRRHPVLLNRAPTLHRLGIQAFQPRLVHGRAILLHPLVCTAFNADFDGDQMAVHVPLSPQARGEAWKLLWSRNNLLSPATGQPILTPSQDMVLGCYYLTAINRPTRVGRDGWGAPSPRANPVKSLLSCMPYADWLSGQIRPVDCKAMQPLEVGCCPEPEANPAMLPSGSPGTRALIGLATAAARHRPVGGPSIGNGPAVPRHGPEGERWQPSTMRPQLVSSNATIALEGQPTVAIQGDEGPQRGPSSRGSTGSLDLGVGSSQAIAGPDAPPAVLRRARGAKEDRWRPTAARATDAPLHGWSLATHGGIRGEYFTSFGEAMQAHHQGHLGVHAPIWVRFEGVAERDPLLDEPLEMRVGFSGHLRMVFSSYQEVGSLMGGSSTRFVRTTIGRILVNSSVSQTRAHGQQPIS